MKVRVAGANEQPMQASKWLDVQVLLEAEEMSLLLRDLGFPHLFQTGRVCKAGEEHLSCASFLEAYEKYITLLRQGSLPEEEAFRPFFSPAVTVTPEVLYAIPLQGNKQILRLSKPAVQMQFHKLGYSKEDNRFHPMAFGMHGILWGVQFSYPQLYRDAHTHEVFNVNESEAFPNTALFKSIQRWIRQHTIPTPFLIGQQRVNVPMRLGKKCLGWINAHPQFKNLNLAVQV